MEHLLREMVSNFEEELAQLSRPQTRQSKQERIKVDGDCLTHVTNRLNKVGLYIAGAPVTPDHCYFEIEIVEAGVLKAMGLGLVPYQYPMDSMPGWRQFSVGYHADDGHVYKAAGRGCPFGPTSSVGDRMGCGVKFTSDDLRLQHLQPVQVFFTRNGKTVGTVSVPYPPGGLYPAVGLHSLGEKVRLNLNAVWDENLVTIPRQSRHRLIDVDGNCLSYVGNQFQLNNVGLYIAANPLTKSKFYFEIEILNAGSRSAIGLGLVPYEYPMDKMPGWNEFSIGYHADDGKLFKAFGRGRPFGPLCDKGDRMGCGIKFKQTRNERLDTEHLVFFTKNGVEIGTVTVPNPQGGLYPAVGMRSNGEKVRLNLDAKWQDWKQTLGQEQVDSPNKTSALEIVKKWLEMLKTGVNNDNYKTRFDKQSHPELQTIFELLVEITENLQVKTSKFLSIEEAVNIELQLLKRDITTLPEEKSSTTIIKESNDDPALVRSIKQLRKELLLKKEIFLCKTRGFQYEEPETHSIHDLGSDEVSSMVTDVCAFCATNGKLTSAQYYCKDCSQFGRYICGVCRGNHDMFTNNHNVARIAT